MFQNFEQTGTPNHVATRIGQLRAWMSDHGFDGVIVPRADEHQGEYVAPCSERLRWLTGFSGSAGIAIILANKAALLVDGRYTLQAADQTDTGLMTIGDSTSQSVAAWLDEQCDGDAKIGFDPWLTTISSAENLKPAKDRTWQATPLPDNPIDAIWQDRPPHPKAAVKLHPLEYAGQSAAEKHGIIASALEAKSCDAAFLSDPASIAWALNIRGGDIAHLPVALGFAIAQKSGSMQVYFTGARISKDIRSALDGLAEFKPRKTLASDLERLAKGDKNLLLDRTSTPAAIASLYAEAGGKCVLGRDPIVLPRAQKNATELEGSRKAHLRDGAAMVTFLAWLSKQPAGSITEINAAQKLEIARTQTGKRLGMPLRDISFDTISGSGPNGAIVHYRVTTPTNRTLGDNELFLIDSGGQYDDATTDITRTVAIGEPSADMRKHFTLVLKGMIAISEACFPKGTRGVDLDILARHALWQYGLDYGHGTGHGIGSYLSVHEGPQSISKRGMEPFLAGMILSNEPGYYRQGAYGIRIENLISVSPLATVKDGTIDMHGFETLTFCPIDLNLIDRTLLSNSERDWLNAYHEATYDKLLPLVPKNTRGWLKRATKPIK